MKIAGTKKVLGLDIGSNSIGFSLLELNENYKHLYIIILEGKEWNLIV